MQLCCYVLYKCTGLAVPVYTVKNSNYVLYMCAGTAVLVCRVLFRYSSGLLAQLFYYVQYLTYFIYITGVLDQLYCYTGAMHGAEQLLCTVQMYWSSCTGMYNTKQLFSSVEVYWPSCTARKLAVSVTIQQGERRGMLHCTPTANHIYLYKYT